MKKINIKKAEGITLIAIIILIIISILIVMVCIFIGFKIAKNQQKEITIENANKNQSEKYLNENSTVRDTTESQKNEVTKEKFKQASQEFLTSDENDKNYKIAVKDNQIKISSDERSTILNYDFTNKATFTYVADIKQGMSYEEYEKQTDCRDLIVIYGILAKMQGAEFEDSMSYFITNVEELAYNYMKTIDGPVLITGNMPLGMEATIEKDEDEIYISEFGQHVMKYVNAMYKEKTSFKDTNGINSFEMITEREDVTETSCKLVTTLIVDPSANFSRLKENTNQLENAFNDND